MEDEVNTDSESMDSGPNESSSSSESESEEKRDNIRSELKSMSFAELIKLKEQLGCKVYNEAMFGENSKRPAKKPVKNEFKRDNKNRPREVTVRKQVPLLGSTKSKRGEASQVRDPRFDSNCGEYDRKKFKEDYAFIADIRENELNELKKQLKDKTLKDDERTKIKLLVQRLNNKQVEERKNKQKEEVLTEEQRGVKESRKDGRTPFFSTKRERRARELVQQYVALKEKGDGQLNKHLEKRRKKIKSRDMKALKVFS